MKLYNDEEMKENAIQFFFYWWNVSGQNTEEGYDEWIKNNPNPNGIELPTKEEIEALSDKFDKYSFENFKLGIDFILNKIANP